jgi:hypothetical protein
MIRVEFEAPYPCKKSSPTAGLMKVLAGLLRSLIVGFTRRHKLSGKTGQPQRDLPPQA